MKVTGLRGLEIALNRRLAAVERGVSAAVGDGVRAMAETAQALAPARTGKLDASIVATKPKARDGKVFAVVVAFGDHDTPMVGSIEYGDRDNAAQPFMRPAFNRHEGPIRQAIADAVETALD